LELETMTAMTSMINAKKRATSFAAAFAAAAACLAASTPASASCFFVYGPSNQLVYRSVISPIDLSRPISDGLRSRFSGGHLVMIPDEDGCPDLLISGESQLFAALGFSKGGPGSAIEASPLFKDSAPRTGMAADAAAAKATSAANAVPARGASRGGASRGK
jgi:hypothetical protein